MRLITKMIQPIMNQSDITYIVRLLNKSIKQKDWDIIDEVLEYVQEFQEDPQYEEE